jgi:DNA repair exonuclease SbcCD nuclease subunit
VPQRQGDRWHIGMAHGLCLPDGQDTERSSIIRTSEIASTGWDYLALGHVHGWFDVSAGSVVACYPGPPLRYRSLPENTGFVALVEFDDERGVAVRRVSLD